ncbi:MAG: hypothetical protein ACJ0RV_03250 [Longimicrobiales bacterium]
MDNMERPGKTAMNFEDKNYPEGPSVNFALFKNNYATTDRHPSEVGKIELSEELLKAIVERSDTGQMVVLRVAGWERTSKAGTQYKSCKLNLDTPVPAAPEKVEKKVCELPPLPF